MTYHGHKNYQTWNVLLWINNDENLYWIAKGCESYDDFVRAMKDMEDGALSYETPDNVSWADPTIDRETINNDWVQDFVEESA